MIFSPAQIKSMLGVVDFYFSQFIANNVSIHYLTDYEKKILKDAGIDLETIDPTFDDAFKFGMLAQALGFSFSQNLSYEKVLKVIRDKTFLPLDDRELAALNAVKFQAYNQIKGLGNRIKKNTGELMIDVDREKRVKYEKIIQDAAQMAIEQRLGVKGMSSLIGEKTGDWARDFDRISDYILHDAHDMGRAQQIIRVHGEGALVYKRVFDQACSHCVRLYLTGGTGSKPRIFSVSDLIANGNNIGRKSKDWLPVVGATHPWCRCQLEKYQEGAEWDKDKKRWGKIALTPEEERIRKLIKIKLVA